MEEKLKSINVPLAGINVYRKKVSAYRSYRKDYTSEGIKIRVIRGETSRHLIEAGGKNPGIVVPMGQWHKLECLESGTVIMECKDGAYEPLTEEEILKL